MNENINSNRLADRILLSLQLAVEQQDKNMAELLVSALEMSLTRGSGGKDFVERREISEEIQQVLKDVEELIKKD